MNGDELPFGSFQPNTLRIFSISIAISDRTPLSVARRENNEEKVLSVLCVLWSQLCAQIQLVCIRVWDHLHLLLAFHLSLAP